MKSKQLVLTAISIAALASTCANANPVQADLSYALENNPQLRSSVYAMAAAESRAQAADASRLPTFNFGYDYGKERINTQSMMPDSNGILQPDSGAPWSLSQENRRGFSINSQLPVYNGGRISAQVETAHLDARIANFNVQAAKQDTLLEGITAYLGVARAKTLIELAKQNEATTTKQLDLETKRLDAGGGVKVDAMQAQTRLQIVRERSVYYNQMLREALARYEQTFGRAPDLASMQDLDIRDTEIPATVSEALSLAKQNHPRLKAAMLQIERASHQVTIVQAAKKPVIDLVGSINRTHNTGQTTAKDEVALYLRASWAFNLGGEASKREEAAVSEDMEARSKADVAQSRIDESVRIAWNQVVNGKERLQLLANAASISRSVMKDRKTLRDVGKESALAALDAEVEYYGVLSNKVNSMYDTRIGAYRLMAAMGKLSADDIGIGGNFKLPVKPLIVDIETLANAGGAETPKPPAVDNTVVAVNPESDGDRPDEDSTAAAAEQAKQLAAEKVAVEKSAAEKLAADKAAADKASADKAAAQMADTQRAERILSDKPKVTNKLDYPDDGKRRVIQVGAFTENSLVRAPRLKLERAGITTLVNVATIDGVRTSRVRVGPFTDAQELQSYIDRIKGMGLEARVLTY
jgi:adhesin transport system outer membrane protein